MSFRHYIRHYFHVSKLNTPDIAFERVFIFILRTCEEVSLEWGQVVLSWFGCLDLGQNAT